MSGFREVLERLGIDRLVLIVHDASFPGSRGEDVGRGSPYGAGARAFLRFVRGLGFDGIQLGPQGKTSPINASPYDGSIFEACFLSAALGPLATDPRWGGLLSPEDVRAAAAGRPAGARAAYAYAWDVTSAALDRAFARFVARRERGELEGLAGAFEAFRRGHEDWINPESERDLWVQFVLHEQHADLRRFASGLGLRLYGDLQVGMPPSDAERLDHLFLAGYRMGAPPSRTNPAGQPWGYPVFDPAQRDAAVRDFMAERIDRMLARYDGLRIDHPHGLVCPWVYRAGTADPLIAVQGGARAHESPDLPDHRELAPLAIARPEQIDRGVPRHADGWVRELEDEQVARYALLVDTIVERAQARGLGKDDVICEVLSTCPYPLRRVLERHGLGRFRVTQKASLDDPADVYRSENAAPEDWIMAGNHDTRPVWCLADEWLSAPSMARRASYLADRLAAGSPAFAAGVASDRSALVHAVFADVLKSRARHVAIFFADLFGMTEIYNRPGVVDAENWTVRVPEDFERVYRERVARDEALDLERAAALALAS